MRTPIIKRPAVTHCWHMTDAGRREAALRAQVSAVRRRKPGAFDAETPWRRQHGFAVAETEVTAAAEAAGVRYSTEPGEVVSRRWRYGEAWKRLRLEPDVRLKGDELRAWHERAQALGSVGSSLSQMIAEFDGLGPNEGDPDGTRARIVSAANKWDAAVKALSLVSHPVGGVKVTEKLILLRVLIHGVPLVASHGRQTRLGGDSLKCARRLLVSGIKRAHAAALRVQ